MKKTVVLVVALVALLSANEAYAWGGWAHRFITYTVDKHLEPEVKAKVEKYLGSPMIDHCSWMDEIRKPIRNPKHPEHDYWVQFNCPEFTSLCPITGQPDFAEIRICYIPDIKMVESKSLKLYLFSFRNHGAFHEDCVNIIMKDLIRLMNPKYIEVTGIFLPRGGISIYPYANYGRPGTKYEQMAAERLMRR